MKEMNLKEILQLELCSCRACGLSEIDFGKCKEARRCTLFIIRGCVVDWNIAKNSAMSNSTNEYENKDLAKLENDMKTRKCY